MSKFCLKCGNPLDEQAQFCAKCGAKTRIVCAACGVMNSAGEARCVSCRAPLSDPQQAAFSTAAAQPPVQQPVQAAVTQPGQRSTPYPQAMPNESVVQASSNFPPQQGGYPGAQQGQPQYFTPAPVS